MGNTKTIDQKTKSKKISTEEKIIDSAKELFGQKGFEGTSIRDICQRAAVNVSMISYHFRRKEELYKTIVASIANKIIGHMQIFMPEQKIPENFDGFNREEKINFLFTIMQEFINLFYSTKVSDSELMIIYREQMNPGSTLNPLGYNFFKKLIASILEKDENDKEVVFRSLSIVGQMQSSRILKQFSLASINQKAYTQQDIELIKKIVINQTKAILGGVIKDEK